MVAFTNLQLTVWTLSTKSHSSSFIHRVSFSTVTGFHLLSFNHLLTEFGLRFFFTYQCFFSVNDTSVAPSTTTIPACVGLTRGGSILVDNDGDVILTAYLNSRCCYFFVVVPSNSTSIP